MSTMERRERPMRRWISWVRPPTLPRSDSRAVRVRVARGSMPYSAVTQPRPELRSQPGTPVSTVALQRTRVWPVSMRTEPSAVPDVIGGEAEGAEGVGGAVVGAEELGGGGGCGHLGIIGGVLGRGWEGKLGSNEE